MSTLHNLQFAFKFPTKCGGIKPDFLSAVCSDGWCLPLSYSSVIYLLLHKKLRAGFIKLWPAVKVDLTDPFDENLVICVSPTSNVIDLSSLGRRTGDGGWRSMVNMHAVNGAEVQCSRPIQCWPCCCWMWIASRACRTVATAAVISHSSRASCRVISEKCGLLVIK